MSRRDKRPIDLCPGNARGRRKLKRYKAREKRKLYGQLYAEGFSPSGRALMCAKRFAQQFMRPCIVASPAAERGTRIHEAIEKQMVDCTGLELRVANNFLQQAEAAHRMKPEMARKLKESMAKQGFEVVAEVDDSIVFSGVVDRPIRGLTADEMIVDDAALFGKIRVADETRQGDVVSGRLRLKAFQDAEMDDVKIAGDMEAIARKHGMSDGDIRTLRDRFFKAFPHLKALAKQYKEERR